jgi:hypothetical protein
MYCPQCGAANDNAAANCASCGASLGVPAPGPVSLDDDAGMRMLLPVGRSGWAIAAGYAGLFAFIPFFAPIALVLGIIAIVHLKRYPELHGMGRAVFGLVIGILGTLLLTLGLVGMIIAANQ